MSLAADIREVELSAGTIRYRESGSGPVLLFVHGLLVSGTLWRKVIPHLDDRYRCIAPDWPLGAHTIPMKPGADISPRGIAGLVAEFAEALDLSDVTLVGNDTGGGIAQLVAGEHPERIGRLVLTPCDAFDNFPPKFFKLLPPLARAPIALNALIQPMRINALRRVPLAFGWVAKRPIPREVTDDWLAPYFKEPAIRRDLVSMLRGLSGRELVENLDRLRAFDRPVLLAWASEDKLFPTAHAHRLAREVFRDARVEFIPDSYAFVSEDQPERTAELIASFVPVGSASNA